VADNWHTGNANDEAEAHRGWLLGHFIEPNTDVRSTPALEVKWGIHPAGDQRHEWTTDEHRTTLVILVQGTFRVDLSVGSVTLQRQGDYVTWGLGIDHTWHADADSTVITVRWPSLTDY
jgi:quercetin dioxygenase-like cupin family protein